VRTGAATRGWRGSRWLSPVDAVDDVAWTKSGVEEGFRRLGTVSTSSPECKGALGLVVGCSREKEWRGRSTPFCGRVGLRKKRGGDGGGLVQVAPRGGRRREGLGSVAPRGGGQCGGAWRRRAAGGGGRWLSSAHEAGDERGGRSSRAAVAGPLP
jgi:hypothetical protein